MRAILAVLQQAVPAESYGWWDRVRDFIDTPAPYSPFSEYLIVLLLLWLLARYDQARIQKKRTFERQAQDVLEEKRESGELSQKAYDKYRQDISLRPKR